MIGMLAQAIDGALGMAYSVTVTTCLNSFAGGVLLPSVVSACLPAFEIFITGSAAVVYMRLRSVNMKLFRVLATGGALGAIAGAVSIYFLEGTYLGYIKPLIS